ncbi:MAG: RDD family protein [Bacilli bacterium]|nr:RDD family protein [Bacilli bacterium]
MKHIQIASLKKRLLSSLIDLTLVVGLFCLFYFCVFTKAVSSVQNYDHLNEVINEEKIDSNLFISKDNKIISLFDDNPKAGEAELEPPIHNFYIDYLHNKDQNYTEYWYDVHILYLDDVKETYKDEKIVKPEITLFDWDIDKKGESYHKKSDRSQDEFNEFYRLNYSTALRTLEFTDPIKSALITMSWGNIRAALYASLVATIIPCFIIPISLRNGKTIGKLLTKLVVLTDEGYEYKRYKHIFRYLAFYLFEVFGGVVTIGLTLILTTSLTLFTKKRRALHDYIAFSVVVDEVNSVFYKDEVEELEYQKKSLEKLSA